MATPGKILDGFINKRSFEVSIAGFNSKKISFLGLEGKAQFSNGGPVNEFTAYIAIEDKPNLVLADDFTEPLFTLDYSITTSEDVENTWPLTFEFNQLIAGPEIHQNYYCYRLSNVGTSTNTGAPLFALNRTANTFYTGSIQNRVKDILKAADVFNHCQINFSSLTATTNRRTVTQQEGVSYWEVLQDLMKEASFTCFWNSKGKLQFTDSTKDFPLSLNVSGSLFSAASFHHGGASHPLKTSMVYDVQALDEGRATKTLVKGYDVDEPEKFLSGTAGAGPEEYVFYTDDISQKACQDRAEKLLKALSWNWVSYSGTTFSTPPALGETAMLSWTTHDSTKLTKEIMPTQIVVSLSGVPNNNGDVSKILQEWTNIEPEKSEFKFIAIPPSEDGTSFPCPSPLDTANKEEEIKYLHAVTVNKDGGVKDTTHAKDNQIAIGFPMENTKGGNYKIHFARLLTPFSLSNALPPAGSPIMVRLFHRTFYVEATIHQGKLTTDVTLKQDTTTLTDPQARITISKKNEIVMQPSKETKLSVSKAALEIQVTDETKQAFTKEGVQTKGKRLRQDADDVETSAKRVKTDATTSISAKAPPTKIQMNTTKV